ncbi:MAG: ATP-binding protein, partial [Desulfuromonadales bacterium]|nr:ATP-binding protein [Desulfuromonadales bacterium]
YRLSHFSIEHSHSAMVWLNLKGDVTDFNRKFCDYTGYAREDLLKMSAETICESCATQIREMDQSGDNMDSIQIEEDLRCKDGSFMPALIEVSRFSFEGEEMLLAVVTDITRRKRAEEVQAQLEVELRQSHKMEAIGTLAGGIAHDFNNILTSMIGCTEMAINRSVDDEQLTKYLGVVRDGERRAAELVAQILAFARQDDNTIKKPLRLNETVSEAMKLLRASIPSTVAIKMSLPDECPEILANSSQLLQVIINLVTNAYQALSDDQGCLHISLDVEEVTTTQAATYLQITPGAYLVLCVADNGCGISEEDLDRVFDPYFTTRELGAGTGFGLSIVKRMVSSHDGMVIVESTLGQGSEFKVYLPILNRGSAS